MAEFVSAQDAIYDLVLQELAAGEKDGHWMWFIFPQVAGLGFSTMSLRFGIADEAEARSYMDDDILGPRLLECTQLMMSHTGRSVESILPYPDDLKFRSCMTLFAAAVPDEPIFQQALDSFFKGVPDARTIELLQRG